jgi:hypothetical protein
MRAIEEGVVRVVEAEVAVVEWIGVHEVGARVVVGMMVVMGYAAAGIAVIAGG